MDCLENLRRSYAESITAKAGASDRRLTEAFARVPREKYVGPGPWRMFDSAGGLLETPSDDPAFLYQDVVVALRPEEGINNGQPSLHAACLAAVKVREGETVVHVGAGAGYYTAILGQLCGPSGRVIGYEIHPDLAKRAAENLSSEANCSLRHRSGSEGPLEGCDVIYVSAGASTLRDVWLDAMRPGGRLLLPLTPSKGAGGMLLVTRRGHDSYDARFLCSAIFIGCIGARDEETANQLTKAFQKGFPRGVCTLHRNSKPDDKCWCSGSGWWLRET